MTSRQRLALGVARLTVSLAVTDTVAIAVALNRLRTDLHASTAALVWTLNAYPLAYAILLPCGAVLGARHGHGLILGLGLGLAAVASTGCAASGTIGFLIAWRAVQGAACALAVSAAASPPAGLLPPEAGRRPFSGSGVALPTAGLLAGGVLVEAGGWRWLFAGGAVLGALGALGSAALARTSATVREPGRAGGLAGPQPRLELPGRLAIGVGVLGLAWTVTDGRDAGWSSAQTLAALTVGVLATGFQLVWHVPLGGLHARVFIAVNVAQLCLSASLCGGVFLLARYFPEVIGDSPYLTALDLAATTAALVPGAWAFAALGRHRARAREVAAIGLALQALALAWLAWAGGPRPGHWPLLAALSAAGFGAGLAVPAAREAAAGFGGRRGAAPVPGLLDTVHLIGGVLGVAGVGALLVARASARLGGLPGTVVPVAWALAGIALTGTVAACALPRPE